MRTRDPSEGRTPSEKKHAGHLVFHKRAFKLRCCINYKDLRVDEGQWNKLLIYLGSDEAKKLSNHCKLARQNKKMNHTTGKKPFAAVRDKMRKDNGRTPTRVELFDKI